MITQAEDKFKVSLPQGKGFQFIHRINDLNKNEVFTEYDYRADEVILLADHFPGQAIFPGVCLQEGMNQTAIQIAQSRPEYKGCNFFFATARTKFHGVVTPPATIIYTAKLDDRISESHGTVTATARVGDQLVAETTIGFIVMPQ